MAAEALIAAVTAIVAVSGPPPALKPTRVAGAGLYVRDLEAEKGWYIAKLGMTVVTTFPQYHEYVLGFGGGPNEAVVTLQGSERRPEGVNLNSRLILRVPDAKALAAWLQSQGVQSREAVKDVAYFVSDPEDNPIELYTPPSTPDGR